MRTIIWAAAMAAMFTVANSGGCTINMGDDDVVAPEPDVEVVHHIEISFPTSSTKLTYPATFAVVGAATMPTVRLWMGDNPGQVVDLPLSGGRFEIESSGLAPGWHTVWIVEGLNGTPSTSEVQASVRFEILPP